MTKIARVLRAWFETLAESDERVFGREWMV